MACKFCNNASPFQTEYANGGNMLHLMNVPMVNFQHDGGRFVCGDLGYAIQQPKVTTDVSLMSREGKSVTISGDYETIISILEKLK